LNHLEGEKKKEKMEKIEEKKRRKEKMKEKREVNGSFHKKF
jgi:hypothetical protein